MRIENSSNTPISAFQGVVSVPAKLFRVLIEIKILEVAQEISRAYRESLSEQKRLADIGHEKKRQMSSSHVRSKETFKERRVDWSRLSGDVINSARPLHFPV